MGNERGLSGALRAGARPAGRALLVCAALAVLSGCTFIGGPEARREHADDIASAAGLVKAYVPAGRFVLTTYRRYGTEPNPALVVYIEGDGRAWRSPTRVSADPSPTDPLALQLASRDPAPAVLYLARPCQFTTPDSARGCEPAYWAHRRFAPEVVNAMAAAIDGAKREARAGQVHLVGYSGGGVLAVLLAARRGDVATLVTIAAPLDLAAWVAHHDVSPLDGSLDPATDALGIEDVPQRHLAGAKDDVVPPEIIEKFARLRLPGGAGGTVERVKGQTHRCCWLRGWRERIAALRATLAGR